MLARVVFGAIFGGVVFFPGVFAARVDGPEATAFEAALRRATAAPSLPAFRAFADAAFLAGRQDEALTVLAKRLTERPSDAEARVVLGVCLRRLGRLQEAERELSLALDHAPTLVTAYREYLLIARQKGELPAAIRALGRRGRHASHAAAELSYARAHAYELAYRFPEALALLGRVHTQVPERLLSMAHIRHEQARLAECTELAEEGLRMAETQGEEGWLRVQLILQASRCRYNRSQIETAREGAERALALAQDVGDSKGKADALYLLGLTLAMSSSKADEAPGHIAQALAIHEALGELGDQALDIYTLNLIGPFDAQTRLAGMERAIDLSRRAGDHRTEVRALGAAGSFNVGMGRLGVALGQQLAALRLAERIGSVMGQAPNAANLSGLFSAIGDDRQAWAYGQRAVRLYRLTGNGQGEATTLASLGDQCFQRQRFACAVTYHRRALTQLRKLNSIHVADALIGLGRDLQHLGRIDEALRAYEEARRFETPDGRNFHAGPALLAMADALLQAGRASQAQEHYQAVLRDEQIKPDVAIQAERGLAACRRAAGAPLEALEHYRKALSWSEQLRENLRLSELRTAYFADKRSLYLDAVGLLHELQAQDPLAGHDREAFRVAEMMRTRTLLEALTHPNGLPRGGAEVRRLRTAIAHLQGRLSRASGDEHVRLEKALAEQEKRLQEAQTMALVARSSEADEPVPAIDVDAAAALLPRDGLLLAFLFGPRRSYLFVLSPQGDLQLHDLPPRGVIEAQVVALRRYVGRRPEKGTYTEDLLALRRRGRRLWSTLFGAVEARLESVRQLVIIPDGALTSLPLEVLTSDNGQYLAEQFDISYVPSAGVLAAWRARATEPAPHLAQLLAFADPAPLEGVPEFADSRGLQRAVASRTGAWAPLPGARREVRALARLFRGDASQVLVGPEFREATVLRELERPYRYVHFATHALIDERRPERSGLLAYRPPDTDVDEDGIVDTRELADLTMSADLVTLSACATGLGTWADGEGLLGLTRAFQMAGVRGVVASLWPASDYATEKLMVRFYEALKAGRAPQVALAGAKRAMLHSADRSLRHPYYWASFVFFGAADRIDTPPNTVRREASSHER